MASYGKAVSASPTDIGVGGSTVHGTPTSANEGGGGGASTVPSRTGTSRACQRCRKHKSKCIWVSPVDAPESCRRCKDAKVACVFTAPVLVPTVQSQLTNGERIARLEERQRATELSLQGLGLNVQDFISHLDSLPLLASVSTNVLEKVEQDKLVDSLDHDDVTSSDVLRFGREQRDDSRSDRVRATKRRRLSPAPPEPSEPDSNHQTLAFDIFSKRCCISVPFLEPDSSEHTVELVRARSGLLYWAIIAVGAREAEELASTHDYARRRAVHLSRLTFGRKPPTLDDFQGFCIVQVWLAPIRPVGHLISLAQELDLHKAALLISPGSTPDPEILEQVRIWGFVSVTDGLFSLATGKPRQVLPQHSNFSDAIKALLLQSSRIRDHRLVAQIELTQILCVEEPAYVREEVPSEDFQLLQQRNVVLDCWGVKWRQWGLTARHADGVFSAYASILLQYSFAKLHLNSRVLRGIRGSGDVSASRLVYAHVAVQHAQDILRVSVEHYQPPVISYTSEFSHLQITFAALFLLKICRLLPTSFDIQTIFNQISETTTLLSHIRGNFHGTSLRLMHQHVHAELHAQGMINSVDPTLASKSSAASFATDTQNDADESTASNLAYSGFEALGLPDGWADIMTAPTFGNWEGNSIVQGLNGGGFNLFGDYAGNEDMSYSG